MSIKAELESDLLAITDALRRADESGNTEKAKRYAQAYKKIKGRLGLVSSNPAEYDPDSQEYKDKYGPVSGSATQNFLAGAGKFLYDRARGIGQLAGIVDEDAIDDARQRDAALMDTKAGIAGNIIGGAAFTAPIAAIPGANSLAGATLMGAGLGLTEPLGTGDRRLTNVALGAAGGWVGQKLGNALGGGRGGLVDDSASALNRSERQALVDAEKIGFRATPGEASGSKSLKRLEAALESKSFTSGPIDAIKDANQIQANRIVARSIGEVDDVVDASTLGRAHERMSAAFTRFAETIPVRAVNKAHGGRVLREIADEFDGLTETPLASNQLFKMVSDMVESGRAEGKQLRSLTSKLGKKANSLLTSSSGDRDLGKALFAVKNYVDDIIGDGLGEADQAGYAELRRQYRNYINLTRNNNNVNPSSGNVNLNSIASTLQKKDKGGFLRGGNQSDLYKAARFGQAFKPIVGNSGTATRNQGPVDFLMGLPLNVGSRMYFSQPATAIAASANRGLKAAGGALGPLADPRLLGLLGAQSALVGNR